MKAILTKLRDTSASVIHLFTARAHHQPANFANIKALLLHLCDFDEAKAHWVMCWLAYPLRHPGAKMAMALVVNGEQGTGKSLFFNRVVTQLYEAGHVRVLQAAQFQHLLHLWANGTSLAVVDGVFSKKNAARLKELVASNRTTLAGCTNFVFLSTSCEFLPVVETDPRLCVLESPPPHVPGFYQAVKHEIDNGGVAAFREYLLRGLDLGGFDQHTRPPADAAQRAIQVA